MARARFDDPMTPSIADPVLRAQLIAEILERARAWRNQAVGKSADTAQSCRLRAAVLEQLAHDLEGAATVVEVCEESEQ